VEGPGEIGKRKGMQKKGGGLSFKGGPCLWKRRGKRGWQEGKEKSKGAGLESSTCHEHILASNKVVR